MKLKEIGSSFMRAIQLNEIEQDTTRELLNIAMGKACANISQLTKKEVLLCIPEIEVSEIEKSSLFFNTSHSVAVAQAFTGELHGDILLVFPEDVIKTLAGAITGDIGGVQAVSEELETDAIIEVGNIVLNTCLAGITNQLGCEVASELPRMYRGKISGIFKQASINVFRSLLFKTRISIEELNFDSQITILMGSESFVSFHMLLDRYMKRIGVH